MLFDLSQMWQKRWNIKTICPGFGQDRVNFHRNPGWGTAGQGDWPHLAKQSRVFHTMCRHAGFGWEWPGGRELTHGSGAWVPVRSGRAALWVVRFVLCFLLICIVVVTVPFVCCSVKLPLSRPTSFACFFPFSSAPRRGEGRPRGTFVASCSQTITQFKVCKVFVKNKQLILERPYDSQ